MLYIDDSGPLLWVLATQSRWRNIPNLSQRQGFTILTGHPVVVNVHQVSQDYFNRNGQDKTGHAFLKPKFSSGPKGSKKTKYIVLFYGP